MEASEHRSGRHVLQAELGWEQGLQQTSDLVAYLRKVKTASGATAVQIAVKDGRRDRVQEHAPRDLRNLQEEEE